MQTVDAQREGWTSRFGPVEEMDVVGSQQGINTFQKWFQAFRIIQVTLPAALFAQFPVCKGPAMR